MFYVRGKWLRFRPFDKYQLPEIRRVEDKDGNDVDAPFHRNNQDKPSFTRKLWSLRWPGTLDKPDAGVALPHRVVRNWPACNTQYDSRHWLLTELLEGGLIPSTCTPETVAYFLAVNWRHYVVSGPPNVSGVRFDVAELSAFFAQQVVDAVFTFDHEAITALKYLKWLAEGHRYFPLFQNFDTIIREELMGVSEKAVQLFFSLAFDYQYDVGRRWFARRKELARYAAYLHWVGRTGQGLYRRKAGVREGEALDPQAIDCDCDCDYDGSPKSWNLQKMRSYLCTEAGGMGVKQTI